MVVPHIELYLEKTSKTKDDSFRGVLYRRENPCSLEQPDEITEAGRESEAFFLIADLSLEEIVKQLNKKQSLSSIALNGKGIYSFNFQEKDRVQIVTSFARINY